MAETAWLTSTASSFSSSLFSLLQIWQMILVIPQHCTMDCSFLWTWNSPPTMLTVNVNQYKKKWLFLFDFCFFIHSSQGTATRKTVLLEMNAILQRGAKKHKTKITKHCVTVKELNKCQQSNFCAANIVNNFTSYFLIRLIYCQDIPKFDADLFFPKN